MIEKMLCSILAQLYYRKEVLEWEFFSEPTFMSQKSIQHTATGSPFHEIENKAHAHAHVFKVILICMQLSNNHRTVHNIIFAAHCPQSS